MPAIRHSVMISSTYEDMRDFRAAVIDAANAVGMYAIRMETDSARPDLDLIGASLAKVDEASAYVGLIGDRYGQVPACSRRNRKKLSLTELEYRRAKKRGLLICMFIMHENLDASRMTVGGEDAKASVKLADFKAIAKKDRIFDVFTTPDDLKFKAMKSLFLVRTKLDGAHAAEAAATTITESLPAGQKKTRPPFSPSRSSSPARSSKAGPRSLQRSAIGRAFPSRSCCSKPSAAWERV
jgi:Domain of unknown function (DUF4062)